MYLLAQDAVASPIAYSTFLTVVGVVGFVAAVGIGSVAWYNSKRPVGWEGKERPDIVPDLDNKD